MSETRQGPAGWADRFAQEIREARARRGWTQAELADSADVSVPTINRYENSKTVPRPDIARKLFIALGLDVRQLPVLLGYVTEQEMGTAAPAVGPLTRAAATVLDNDRIPPGVRGEWVAMLQFLASRALAGDTPDPRG